LAIITLNKGFSNRKSSNRNFGKSGWKQAEYNTDKVVEIQRGYKLLWFS